MGLYGSEYGRWFIDEDICWDFPSYCVGVGRDITAETQLLKFDICHGIVGIDPTPTCLEWFSGNEEIPENFALVSMGIWNKDGVATMYAHSNPGFQTQSVYNSGPWTGKETKIQVRRLKTIMNSLGHTRLSWLKLNCGGDAEFDIISDMLVTMVYPEMLSYIYLHWTDNKRDLAHNALTLQGYKRIWNDEKLRRCTYVRN